MPGVGVDVDVVAAAAVAFDEQVMCDAEEGRYSGDLGSNIGDVSWTLENRNEKEKMKSSFKIEGRFGVDCRLGRQGVMSAKLSTLFEGLNPDLLIYYQA